MGGYGSGPGKSLAVIEEGLKLDLRRLRQQGIFMPKGNIVHTMLRWTDDYSGDELASIRLSISGGETGGWAQVSYRFTEYDGAYCDVSERISLVRFPQPFGGFRWYFICPRSGARCQCLYKPCGYPYFRSRQHFKGQLLYRSQKLDWRSRIFEAARRAARKTLKAGSGEWQKKYLDWDFPPKPPRMRWKMYYQAIEKWDQAEHYLEELLLDCALLLSDGRDDVQ